LQNYRLDTTGDGSITSIITICYRYINNIFRLLDNITLIVYLSLVFEE